MRNMDRKTNIFCLVAIGVARGPSAPRRNTWAGCPGGKTMDRSAVTMLRIQMVKEAWPVRRIFRKFAASNAASTVITRAIVLFQWSMEADVPGVGAPMRSNFAHTKMCINQEIQIWRKKSIASQNGSLKVRSQPKSILSQSILGGTGPG